MQNHDRSAGRHALESEADFPLAMRVDFLSQVLTLIRLRGELIFAAEVTAPWGLRFEPGSAYFYFFTEGEATVEASDGRTIRAAAGDLLLLSQGRGHVIGTPGVEPLAARAVLTAQVRDDSLSIRLGGGGAPARMITGMFRFEGDNIPAMLAVLPSVIHIGRAQQATDGEWLMGIAQALLAEAQAHQPGTAIMISRLIDVLVIRAMRIWVRTAPPEDKGWLGALADARISRALKAIHDEPFRRWSIAELTTLAGMSRSSFADRFTTLIGAPPLHYQTRWRLLLANEMLKRSDARVSDVARRVGYESDAAFSRAFKAQFGYAPVLAKAAGGET